MKSIFTLLLFALTFTSTAQQTPKSKLKGDAPKGANLIVVTFDNAKKDSLYKMATLILFDRGFSVAMSDEKLGIINTTEKGDYPSTSKLSLRVEDNRIYIHGIVQMEVSTLNIHSTDPIKNIGMKNSPAGKAWNEMNEFAKATGGKLTYETKE
ncbi:MAG: hypothetical protein JZU65_06150 [Chlorobium sp.]|nr:hypothetical protein [Chlorobium sp.]